MLAAVLFVVLFAVSLTGAIVWLARRGIGERITGPIVRSVDYDNPTSRGTYFWTNLRPR